MTHVVIGGGIIGLLTAYELHSAGEKVTLLEQGQLGKESSWAGGGILSPLYPWRYPDALNDLAAWSQQTYPALINALKAESGIDAQWWQCGFLMLDEAEIAAAVPWARQRQQTLEIAGADRIKTIAPALSANDLPERALWMPEIAQARNPRLLKALIAALRNQGVELHEQSPVSRLLVNKQGVNGVICGNREMPADTVTVACGAWSRQLLDAWVSRFDIAPVRGQMILFKADPALLSTMIMRESHYLIPRRDGRIIAGSTLEYVGFDKSVTQDAKQKLLKMAVTLVPELNNYPIEHHWAGLRPGNSQQTPVVCQHPDIAGLFINTGHFRNGVVTAPASARLCADLILHRPPIVNPGLYRL
ncbi:MAG TPA: glycine oxidase ThiO [Gammaproteobacteria bacterium]